MDKKLATKEMDPPHIVLFRQSNEIKGMYIVGDECKIRCQGSSVTSAVLEIITLYYNFNIDYPKCFAMVLGIIQQCCLGEPYTYQTSKKFKFFLKKLNLFLTIW